MTPVWRVALSVTSVVAAGAAGWLSVASPNASAMSARASVAAPAGPRAASSAIQALTPASLPGGPVTAPGQPARRVPTGVPLSGLELEYVRRDPVEWSKQMLAEARPVRAQMCHARLAHPSDEDCERIYQAMNRVAPQYLGLQKQFLTGQIDQDAYQVAFHRIMIEQSIDLEEAMSPRDYYAYFGIPQAEDLFLNVNGGIGRMEHDHFKLGNDVFDRIQARGGEVTP